MLEKKNEEIIGGLYPEILWQNFAAISAIPRESRNEFAVVEFVLAKAKEKGLSAKKDKVGNVVVIVPASAGMENVPSICLQSHLDMVCEKTNESTHNFLVDPIKFRLTEKRPLMLSAIGTTLGADNGIGIGTELALMEDSTIKHGPLELLFTIDEETGLNGAFALEPNFIKSKTLINLDSEDWGMFFVSSAGGIITKSFVPFSWKDERPDNCENAYLRITASGFKGGHSGADIDKFHENPIKVVGRIMSMLSEDDTVRLVSIQGGNKPNAIPREATIVINANLAAIPWVRRKVQNFCKVLKNEIHSFEPDFKILIESVSGKGSPHVMNDDDQEQIIQIVSAMPHGVIRMSPDIKGLVQTSTNLGAIKTTKNGVTFLTMQRSSVDSEILETRRMVDSVIKLPSYLCRTYRDKLIPGWKANPESPILTLAKKIYRDISKVEAKVEAIHAGLECGIIGAKYAGMDCISLGPTIKHVHSPSETIDVDSVREYWNFLLALLEAMPEGK